MVIEGYLACNNHNDTASVHNGNLRRPMTFAPIAEHLAVELSLPTKCRGWDSNTQLSAYGANALIDCATAS